MKIAAMTCALIFTASASFADDFSIKFTWEGLKSCTSGQPNTVPNPIFNVTGVPAGTKAIYFKLIDLDVPNYNHGGGWVMMTGDGKIPAKSFKYKSPCPPNGTHTYEWRAQARTARGSGGETLATAKAQRPYPE